MPDNMIRVVADPADPDIPTIPMADQITQRPPHLHDSTADVEQLRATLLDVAPGTPLRDGLDRILRGGTGALVVLGFNEQVAAICSGGFLINADFTAARLRELAKMDGAVVVDQQRGKIVRAGVQLLPSAEIPTSETGTRHRTAERVALQTGFPVIAVSKSMNAVAVYAGGFHRNLEDTGEIASRAKQAIATLERYRSRLDEVSANLSALEVEDLVTVRDIAQVAQRQEMVARIGREIDGMILELGDEGRLLQMQYEELIQGVATDRHLLLKDYARWSVSGDQVTTILSEMAKIEPSKLIELEATALALGLANSAEDLDKPASPRGYRFIQRIPRIPLVIAERLVDSFGTLQRLLAASMDDLQAVEGVGEQRARAIREGLSRIAESSILERLV